MSEITLRNEVSEVARAAAFLDRFALEHHLAPGVLAEMQVVLDELLKNLIDYAYKDDMPHEILLRLQIADNVLQAEIEDDGVPFDPLSAPPPDLKGGVAERRIGGLGLHFVRNLMSEVTYGRVGNRNRLVLKKRLKA